MRVWLTKRMKDLLVSMVGIFIMLIPRLILNVFRKPLLKLSTMPSLPLPTRARASPGIVSASAGAIALGGSSDP